MTPEEASPLIGVPAVQLRRWAWERVGPKNSGSAWKPKYEQSDLDEWISAKRALFPVKHAAHNDPR